MIISGKVNNNLLEEIMPLLYDRIEELIDLRYNNDACMSLIFPAKGSHTLFYSIGLIAMHFTSYLLNPT